MGYTKGKWITIGESEPVIVCKDKDVSVAMCFDITGDEQKANARLIAAAPVLLATLKGDEENCVLNVSMILSQALLGNYEAVKTMLRGLCSINAKAIAQAEK